MRKIAIIDERATSEVIRTLELRGYHVITLPAFSTLGEAVKSHTDMLIFKADDTIFTYADYCDERMYVMDDLYMLVSERGIKFSFLPDIPKNTYPYDAMINVLTMGKYLFAKTDTVSPSLLSHLSKLGYKTVHVNQGYPACTVLRLNCKAAITADRGMAKAMSSLGIKVTLIDNGYFKLPPHDYGFIGGSAGVDGDTVYFTGNLEGHPSYQNIIKAIEDEGMRAVYLSSGIPFDIGGILFC